MSNLTVFDPQPFQITVKTSPRRKTIGMRITDTGELSVLAPPRISKKTLIKLIKQHENWIFTQLQNNPKQELFFIENTSLYYMGETRHLKLEIGKKKSVLLNDTVITVTNTKELLNSEKMIQIQLEKWYINTARDIIEDRVHFYANLINEPINTVRLKNTQTRWGSCSSKRNININWRLIMAPFEVMDYVILHEVCHLKHLDHSASFWTLVKQIMPNYTDYTIWLKNNSTTLFWP